MATTYSGHDGTYTLTWTLTDAKDTANTVSTSLTLRVINDVCTPNLQKTGAFTGSPYTYAIGSGDYDIPIPGITNGDCLACMIVHVDD